MTELPLQMELPARLREILDQTPELQRSFLVGGCVRDALLRRTTKDFDIEVYGIDYPALETALRRWGKTDLVGRSFGVVKLSLEGSVFDFTIPRTDSKVAPGHKGFEVHFHPDIEPREAAGRRDFTVNALMWDPRTQRVLDFFGGLDDLKSGILRHTSPAFVEDPLRVLRGMQFASRFELNPAPETVALCQTMAPTYPELAVERVRDEWFKWAAQSRKPSIGLHFLEATGWIVHFPELRALRGTPQEAEWHPEGDVFDHTAHCCDALAGLDAWTKLDLESRIVQMLAVLTHDMGKPSTTSRQIKRGVERIVSPGHDEAGVSVAEAFLDRIETPIAIRKRVLPLVACHMAHLGQVTDRGVRRLARRLHPETIESLCLVISADAMGRPPLPPKAPSVVGELLRKAGELKVQDQAPRPILQGKHLIPIGFKPGPGMGQLLHEAFEAQLEGEFSDLDGALEWLRRRQG